MMGMNGFTNLPVSRLRQGLNQPGIGRRLEGIRTCNFRNRSTAKIGPGNFRPEFLFGNAAAFPPGPGADNTYRQNWSWRRNNIQYGERSRHAPISEVDPI